MILWGLSDFTVAEGDSWPFCWPSFHDHESFREFKSPLWIPRSVPSLEPLLLFCTSCGFQTIPHNLCGSALFPKQCSLLLPTSSFGQGRSLQNERSSVCISCHSCAQAQLQGICQPSRMTWHPCWLLVCGLVPFYFERTLYQRSPVKGVCLLAGKEPHNCHGHMCLRPQILGRGFKRADCGPPARPRRFLASCICRYERAKFV